MGSVYYDIYVKGGDDASHEQVRDLFNLLKNCDYLAIQSEHESAVPYLATDIFRDRTVEGNLKEIALHWGDVEVLEESGVFHLNVENNMVIEPFIELMYEMNVQGVEVHGYSTSSDGDFFHNGKEYRQVYEGVDWRWLKAPQLLMDLEGEKIAFIGDLFSTPIAELKSRAERIGAVVVSNNDCDIDLLVAGISPDQRHIDFSEKVTLVIGESRFIATLKEQEESFEQRQEWEKSIAIEEENSEHHAPAQSGLIAAVSSIKKIFKI